MDNEDLNYLIEFELENTKLDFKRDLYDNKNKPELIKDVMAMANAHYEGTKYIIFGVKLLEDGSREYNSIQSIPDQSDIEELIDNNIEPTIDLSFYPYRFQGYQLAILEINGFSDRPYMLKKDNQRFKAGESQIRKGSTTSRVSRDDLEKIYSIKSANISSHKILIGFDERMSKELDVNIEMNNIEELPSSKNKRFYEEQLIILRDYIEKENADSLDKSIETNNPLPGIYIPAIKEFQKLTQKVSDGRINIGNNYMGLPIRLSEEELIERINSVKEDFNSEDLFFIQENFAQEFNPYILNSDSKFIEDVIIHFYIPKEVGWVIPEYYSEPKNNPLEISRGNLFSHYPTVEEYDNEYVITEYLGEVRHHYKREVLAEPLKILYSKEMISKDCSIKYEVHGRNISIPIEGFLMLKFYSDD
ncbi:AlbA family DNA-binding domain-containing protein [Fundicoccus culcitae]|uniref:ATP-binding protein n=1 Tax=Fundicoccus culcitae TaxID=2969821 RepID=A0ABY5P3N7_9LACT|nr:ATP-binding protein [Fundicoccus culcitae]UUX33354.1 ATP-binding protein [Fundicoccus culcitae]